MPGHTETFGSHVATRFVTRIALNTTGIALGFMVLGDPLGGRTWVDISEHAQGHRIERGAPAGNRPGAGKLTFRLVNDDGQFSRPQSMFYGPGTLIQVGILGASTYMMFTGLVTRWAEASGGSSGVNFVDVTCLETISLLTDIDDPALDVAVGNDDILTARVQRIVDNARWPFPVTSAHLPQLSSFPAEFSPGLPNAIAFGYQATTLAQPAWSEILLTADSLGCIVVGSRTGGLAIYSLAFGTGYGTSADLGGAIPIEADSIRTSNDDDRILGQVTAARVGGTAMTATNDTVEGRYQRRSTQRLDLITKDTFGPVLGDLDLAYFVNAQLYTRNETYRVDSCELDTAQGSAVWEFIAGPNGITDPYATRATVTKPEPDGSTTVFANELVVGWELEFSPLTESSITCHATVQFASNGPDTTWSNTP